MGANGKGNGKKQDRDEASPIPPASARPKNGKGSGAHAGGEEGEPTEREEAHGEEGGEAKAAAHLPNERDDPGQGKAEEKSGGDPSAAAHDPEPEKTGAPGAPGKDAPKPAAEAVRGAAWGHPFARFEQAWTRLEARL